MCVCVCVCVYSYIHISLELSREILFGNRQFSTNIFKAQKAAFSLSLSLFFFGQFVLTAYT